MKSSIRFKLYVAVIALIPKILYAIKEAMKDDDKISGEEATEIVSNITPDLLSAISDIVRD